METSASSTVDARAFARDGYLPIGRVLEPAAVETLRREHAALFALNELESDEDGLARDLAAGEDERMLQATGLCERNIHFRQLVCPRSWSAWGR